MNGICFGFPEMLGTNIPQILYCVTGIVHWKCWVLEFPEMLVPGISGNGISGNVGSWDFRKLANKMTVHRKSWVLGFPEMLSNKMT